MAYLDYEGLQRYHNKIMNEISTAYTEGIEITVTGATPTITANANTRYICGTVTSLTITPPAHGVCEIIFTSGSTPTTLTLPSSVHMPEWFDATALETNTIYEISIIDGTYGAVMTWQV